MDVATCRGHPIRVFVIVDGHPVLGHPQAAEVRLVDKPIPYRFGELADDHVVLQALEIPSAFQHDRTILPVVVRPIGLTQTPAEIHTSENV
ncbi:hypothetical protein D3C87_1709360 [compost metagenome]